MVRLVVLEMVAEVKGRDPDSTTISSPTASCEKPSDRAKYSSTAVYQWNIKVVRVS